MYTQFFIRAGIISLICWGFFIPYFWFRVKYKTEVIKKFWYVVALYFTSAIIILKLSLPALFNSPQLSFPPNPLALIALGAVTIIIVTLTQIRHMIAPEDEVMAYIEKYPGNAAPSLQLKYFVTNISHVLFQQALVGASVIAWHDLGQTVFQIALAFGFFFGIGHLVLYYFIVLKKRTMSLAMGLFFSIASFVGGFIFSYLILDVPSGYVYAFLVHIGYYIILGVVMRYRIGRSLMVK